MLRLNVLQVRWVILAVFGGFSLVLVGVLCYLALWRRREPEGASPETSLRQWLRSYVPWVLVLTYASAFAYAVVYVVMRALRPPNW